MTSSTFTATKTAQLVELYWGQWVKLSIREMWKFIRDSSATPNLEGSKPSFDSAIRRSNSSHNRWGVHSFATGPSSSCEACCVARWNWWIINHKRLGWVYWRNICNAFRCSFAPPFVVKQQIRSVATVFVKFQNTFSAVGQNGRRHSGFLLRR